MRNTRNGQKANEILNMGNPLEHIDRFFETDSFSSKELNNLFKEIGHKGYNQKAKKDIIALIQIKLKNFKKHNNIYKRPENQIKSLVIRKPDFELVKSYLSLNKGISNVVLADKLELSYKQLEGVAIKHGLTNFHKEGVLTKTEQVKLYEFLDSRLFAMKRKLERKKSKEICEVIRRKNVNPSKPRRNKSNNIGSVYDVIEARGGTGKLIYNSMRK
jgi:hypothetical protein